MVMIKIERDDQKESRGRIFMGYAEELFDRIIDGGGKAIDGFIADRQSEELYLDFKRSADNGASHKLHQNDRNNLGKAISGFGNSEGGVIVWGVDCKEIAEKGDVAYAKHPIQNPKRFKSWLESRVSGCTVPAHRGVRHQEIEAGDGTGYVATLIPQSLLAPHQCVPECRYYMRAGSDFSPVPHAVLAGMFGRRPQAILSHSWRLDDPQFDPSRQPRDPAAKIVAHLNIRNRGPGIARDLYVNFVDLAPATTIGVQFTSHQFTSERASNESISAISKQDFRLGPHGQAFIASLTFQLDMNLKTGVSYSLSYGCSDSPIEYISHLAKIQDCVKIVCAERVPEAKQLSQVLLAAARSD
jgi:hypothetical protein